MMETAHGTPLAPGPGSEDVLIEGLPAWRAGLDMHICPLVTGPVPHIGGVTAPMVPTVLINGLPAATMGDVIVEEGGPPNTILTGAPTVFIE